LSVNFLLEFYQTYREELIRYGLRFDKCLDTAKDLLEDCHDKLCKKNYPLLAPLDYLKIMKRSMGNLYTDHLRKAGYLVVPGRCKFPELFTPKSSLPLEEQVCRQEELGFLREALTRISSTDQEILLREGNDPSIKKWRVYQAKKRLELQVILVMAEQKQGHEEEERQQQEQRQHEEKQESKKKEGKQ